MRYSLFYISFCVKIWTLLLLISLSAVFLPKRLLTISNRAVKPRIAIISDDHYCGERELAWRVKIAADRLGWEAVLDESRGRGIRKEKGFDWVINITPLNAIYNRYCNNYVAFLHPFKYLQKQSIPFYEIYSGYLLTINREEVFEKFLQSKNKPFFSVPFYPSVHRVEYKKVALNDLMTMISVWGNRLEDEKFERLYRLLDRGGFTKFYGIKERKGNYLGKIPFDGVSVIQVLQKHGISLVFHSDLHINHEIPSSRIFESAAASCVIISDQNAFVKKNFGETVFYVDTMLSSEEIYQQIKAHVDFIYKNPEKALEMAKSAHQIFIERFSMENQLLEIDAMHKQVLKSERKQMKRFLKECWQKSFMLG